MGQGMVANLLKAGYPTTVWNRSPERCLPFVAQGAKTPKEAAQSADVILYCLADDAAVEQVVFGPSGVLEGVRAGQVAVNMTTQSPALSLREAAAYQAKGVDFLDAPVFGSKNEAAQAGLSRDRFQVVDLRGRRRGADRAQLRDLLCAQAYAEGCQPDRALRRAIERADSRIGGHSGNYQGCGESWLGQENASALIKALELQAGVQVRA